MTVAHGGRGAFALYQTYNQLLASRAASRHRLAFRPAGLRARPRRVARRLEPRRPRDEVFAHFENTALYSPANYLPQTLVFLDRPVEGRGLGDRHRRRRRGRRPASPGRRSVTAAVALAPRCEVVRCSRSSCWCRTCSQRQGAMLATDSSALSALGAPRGVAFSLRVADRGGPVSAAAISQPSPRSASLLGLLGEGLHADARVPARGARDRLARDSGAAGGAPATPTRRSRCRASPPRSGGPGRVERLLRPLPRRDVPRRLPAVRISDQSAQESYLVSHIYDLPALLWNTAG